MASTANNLTQAPYAVSERDGVTLIYDTPDRTVFAGDVDGARFSQLFALAVVAVLPLWLDALHYMPGFYGAILLTLAGGMAARRYAQLRVHQVAWWQVTRPVLWRDGRWFAVAFGAQWLADLTQPQGGGVGLIGWVYLMLVTGLAWRMAQRGPRDMAHAMGSEIKSLPRAIVNIDALRTRHERMLTDWAQLKALPVFDAEAPELLAAWQKKNTDAIERLLRAGDDLNRNSRDQAIAMFNAAKDDIDLGRSRLRHLVKEAEAALASYQIGEGAEADRSGVLEGTMAMASLPAKDWTQKLDYARGTSTAIAKAVAGSGPWQIAAAAVVFSGIMMAVNHQKLLRQLKELEGQVKTQAEAVRGDIDMIDGIFRFRIRPQSAGMLSLIGTLEEHLQSLQVAEDGGDADRARADAFLLASAFREAKHVLEMKAGD